MLLVDLSGGGCRLRAGVNIPPNTKLSFQWTGPSKQPLRLSGIIVAQRMAEKKVAEYGIKFVMPEADRDKLANELFEIQRRLAFKPVEAPKTKIEKDETLGGHAKRQAFRVPIVFAVTVRGKAKKDGKMFQFKGNANDLSMGGLLLVSPMKLEEGDEVTIRFTLPVHAVEMGGEVKEVIESGPFGQRKVKKMTPVRPFEPVEANARIVAEKGSLLGGLGFGA
ncbi:MAG: PilZ domain-containing protein, partial [Candidatus Eremiobacteraeota bacterium]|nr:PilZ domain-containing protein [Candidatus Eremiobacteraeota bacterium]